MSKLDPPTQPQWALHVDRVNSQETSLDFFRPRIIQFAAFSLLAFFFFFLDVVDYSGFTTAGAKVKKLSGGCKNECNMSTPMIWSTKKKLSDPHTLLQILSEERDKLIAQLKLDYGEKYFNDIFVDNSPDAVNMFDNSSNLSFRPFTAATKRGKSVELLKNKIIRKILSLQMAYKHTKKSKKTACDCDQSSIFLERYVWVTAGHSAAAGHGNLYNETYTAYLQRNMNPFFNSIGIDFEARNYGMGGTSSFPELALCFEEIFGVVDFFTWDFGMTDGGATTKAMNFGYAGAISPGRPAMIALRMDRAEKAFPVLEHFAGHDFFPVFVEDKTLREIAYAAVPDTREISSEEANALPPSLYMLKCNHAIENKPCPFEEKYSTDLCSPRGGQVGWHPGFKFNNLIGNMLSLFLADAFVGAAKDLASRGVKDVDIFLKRLKADDDIARDAFMKAASNQTNEFGLQVKAHSICHTGRLPSQTRYLGYLTDTNKTGGPSVVGAETYDVGRPQEEVDQQPLVGELELVWSQSERANCSVVLKPDYKDFFYASKQSGQIRFEIPNKSEQRAYRFNPANSDGLFVFVQSPCDWGNCPADYLRLETAALKEKKIEMKINGVEVIGVEQYKGDKYTVTPTSKNGPKFPVTEAPAVIEIRVNDPDEILKLSAIILM